MRPVFKTSSQISCKSRSKLACSVSECKPNNHNSYCNYVLVSYIQTPDTLHELQTESHLQTEYLFTYLFNVPTRNLLHCLILYPVFNLFKN